ncbi:hypothetical protein FQA39_LY00361 [Lamprigera yunnana]|nr:hypothetical protein FQA39_LY00361 [Lamprigera yunnana]
MKIYIIALICILVEIHAQDEKALQRKYNNALMSCLKTHKLQLRDINDYKKMLEDGGPTVESFCECLLRRLNFIDENSEIMYNEFKKSPFPLAPNSNTDDIVDHCSTEKGSTCSETSFKFLKCILESALSAQKNN